MADKPLLSRPPPAPTLTPSPPERGLPCILIGGPVQPVGPPRILISTASAIQYALSFQPRLVERNWRHMINCFLCIDFFFFL